MDRDIKVIVEGRYALYTRPEFKLERVSYDVPPPGALEGMMKQVYWKPAIRYEIDKIVVFNPIEFIQVRRNEVKEKVALSKVKSQINGKGDDPRIYTSEDRIQRASMLLRNVRYGVQFHFEMTGLRCDKPDEGLHKHYAILRRRLEKGQCFRTPCLGCSEFPIRKIEMVEDFNPNEISREILTMGDVDLGAMSYKVHFNDCGIPKNGDWENPIFSDNATTEYYHPHMINGVIDVQKYRRKQHADSGALQLL